ncbi:P-loop containing nucleoside triphosphate hydrolase protein [Xylaria sp. FL1042]|nr:P-loop containing nucleoside triphosphate hydrolase protein [Xylaria sp. FL1042]KAI0435359.1 P-loop containing nucleoside triphosphate hydrolase protein [Xylaria sp. FL1042]
MRFLFNNSSRLARTSRLSPSFSQYAFFSTTARDNRVGGRSHTRSRSQNSLGRLSVSAAARLQNVSKLASSPRPSKAESRQTKEAYGIFRKLVLLHFDAFVKENDWSKKQSEYTAFGLTSQLDYNREVVLFRNSIVKACDFANEDAGRKANPLFWSLRNAFVTSDVQGLATEIKFAFQNFLMRSRFPNGILATHQKIADLRFPYEWFPATRALQRTIHLHVGPTNSGKTYNALKSLENAKSGIYAGPLRLLAHEVYSRFIAKDKSCALVTGEEQRVPTDADTYFISCTVEMTPLNYPVDVAVIDEIQMIGDFDRGWAWTQAFLGVQAKEVHLCGEERAVELIQSLCATLGDKCIVHRYQRLSGLETMDESLHGGLQNLEKGDAVIAFSRIQIHSLKRRIEEVTGRRCAIIYGSLPPETRAQQAILFNDPDNDYDYLVASDAIGMGLNLEIRRVVFEATYKRSAEGYQQMSVSELKQIGGRAGRYRTANHAIRAGTSDGQPPGPEPRGPGLVTALEDEDLAVVIQAFKTEAQSMKTAGIQVPISAIERMSTYFPPNTPLSFILLQLRDLAKLSPMYHLCGLKEMLEVADLLQPFPMSIYDRCVFLNAPVALRELNGPAVLQAYAKCVSRMEGGNLVDLPEIQLELIDMTLEEWPNPPAEFLRRLEGLHKSITLYLWLSYRFSGVFKSQHLAFHVKELVEVKINEYLSRVTVSDERRKRRHEVMRKAARAQQLREEQLLGGTALRERPRREGVGEWNEEGHEEPLYEDPSQLENITRHVKKSGS